MAMWVWNFEYGGQGPDWAERIYASQCGRVHKSIHTKKIYVKGKKRSKATTRYFITKNGQAEYYDTPERALKALKGSV